MKKGKKRAQTVEITPLENGSAGSDGIENVDADIDAGATGEGPTAPEGFEPAADPAAFDLPEELTPVSPVVLDERAYGGPLADIDDDESWDGPTSQGDARELAELVEASRHPDQAPAEGTEGTEGTGGTEGNGEVEAPAVDSASRLESIVESLVFASDRALTVPDLKRLLGERDAKAIGAALERLQERHRDSGIQLVAAGGGWQFRTHPENAPWVSKLIAGRPARLSRAMLETLAIVAYRQPITRPEIDEIRGVDCGPVLKTLLERVLIRMIGKKEEVGRPILYGTTPEFLRTFSLKDLTELPTLREFHELGVAEMAKVDAQNPSPAGPEAAAAAGVPRMMPAATELPELDPDEEDALLAELDDATSAATRAAKPPEASSQPPAEPGASEASE